jgi:uncharacterized membrane protein
VSIRRTPEFGFPAYRVAILSSKKNAVATKMWVDLHVQSGMLGTTLSEAVPAEPYLAAPGSLGPLFRNLRSDAMQCPVCHNEISHQNAFCNSCGAPMAATAGTRVGATAASAYAVRAAASNSRLSENAAGAIAYLTIIPAIIFLVIEPYNKMRFVRFHSWQSIGFCVAVFLLQVCITIVEMVLHFIPGIVFLFMLIHLAVGLVLFVLWLFVTLQASKGEWYKLPFIGDFAEKQARS